MIRFHEDLHYLLKVSLDFAQFILLQILHYIFMAAKHSLSNIHFLFLVSDVVLQLLIELEVIPGNNIRLLYLFTLHTQLGYKLFVQIIFRVLT